MLKQNELLSLFRRELHSQILSALDKPGVVGMAVYEHDDGRRRVIPQRKQEAPPIMGDDGFVLIDVHWKPVLDSSGSRTQDALAWLEQDKSRSIRAASIKFAVSRQTIMRAQKARIGRIICPCCNQVVREGFTISK